MRRELTELRGVLYALTELARLESAAPTAYFLARTLTAEGTDRGDKMRLILDELNRRFVYSPDVCKEEIGPVPLDREGCGIDVDDACLFVATLAMSLRIPCRFMMRRREKFWMCAVSYRREDGTWEALDPLNQGKNRVVAELLEGPVTS